MAHRIAEVAVGLIALFIANPHLVASATEAERAASIPDLTGMWTRPIFGYEQPDSGPGPLTGLRPGRNVGGDENNPILKPEAAAVVKKRNDVLRSGIDFPTPSSQCMPM